MGDGTKANPFTREDVLRLIEENGGDARRLDLSDKWFEAGINLQNLPLEDINLQNGIFPAHIEGSRSIGARFDGSSMLGANLRNASLQDASFGMYDSKPTAMQGVDLKGAHLENANFQGADLTAAQFRETEIAAPTKPWEFLKSRESLPAYLDNTDFRYAVLTLAQFKGCYFYGTKLEGAYIRGADILEAHLDEADWGSYIIGEEKRKDFYSAEHNYRQLKVWYTQSGYHDIAGKFYYREKEANRKRLKLLSSDWHHRIASELIRAIFGYGERWWNIVFSIEALILLFTFTYLAIAASWEWWRILLLGWIPGLIIWFAYLKFTTGLNWTWWKKAPFWVAGMGFLFCAFYFLSGLVLSRYVFLHHLYFSTVSFTALGYGEWVKLDYSSIDDAIRGIGAFESFVGISMMALLLVTFVRKWTR